MADVNDVPYVPDEQDLRERFDELTESNNALTEEVPGLKADIETALRQLDPNRHYELWSSFCESKGKIGETEDSLSLLNTPIAKLNTIFDKLDSQQKPTEEQRVALLEEAEPILEGAEDILHRAQESYEDAKDPDPDNLPPNLD